jgi:hypothetical protein
LPQEKKDEIKMPERPRAQRVENEKDISKPYVKPRPHTS